MAAAANPVAGLVSDPAFGKLSPPDKAKALSGVLAKTEPGYSKLSPDDQAKVVSGIGKSHGMTITPHDFLTGKAEAAMVGFGARELGSEVKQKVDTTEKLLRNVPPIITQTAGAVGGGLVGGEPGAMAGGAVASVLNDYYDRFLNHMYGEPNQPVSYAHEATSAVLGALTSEGPRGAKAISGLSGAEKIAQGAAAGARQEGAELAAQQAATTAKIAGRQSEAQAALDAEKARIAKEKTGVASDIIQRKNQAEAKLNAEKVRVAKLQTEQEARIKAQVEAKSQKDLEAIQSNIDQSKSKLRVLRNKAIEDAREGAATQVGAQQIQQMASKTPQQFAQQEATTSGEQFAAQRAAAQAPVFSGAQAYHEEVGKAFEPYIGPHKADPIAPEGLDKLHAKLDEVQTNAEQRGHNINDSELNKITARLKEGTEQAPQLKGDDFAKLFSGKSGTMSNAAWEKLQGGAKSNPLTVGELWGYRTRLGYILSKSTNPAVRLAAHELSDEITDLMPDIPDKVRQAYSAQRAQFPRSLMGEVAQARNPAEVGRAIFGTPASPEPAQVSLNLIRRAKTPEAMEGLRTAFADNWLSKPHNPDDIGRFNPQVIKELYGKDADAVFKLLGHDGSFKSRSWQELIAANPAARDAMLKAEQDAMDSETGKALQSAISVGEKALRDYPSAYTMYQEAIKSVKKPEGRIAALTDALQKASQPTEGEANKLAAQPSPKLVQRVQKAGQPTEKEAETLAKQPPSEKDAAIKALGKRGLAPDSRLERMALAGLAFRAYFALAGAGGAIMKHPEAAVAIGGLLGGRGIIRLALSNPNIARVYVNMIDLAANPKNALSVGNMMGQLTAASALQYVKDSNR